MTDDNVILFPKAPDDAVTPPVERKPKPKSYSDDCVHRRRLILDDEAHQLRCSDCGQVLDPFQWMVEYVGKWESANAGYRQAKQQLKQAREELAKIEKKVASRRAAARRPGVLLTAGDARLLRDQFSRLLSLVVTLTRDREDALRQAHLHGFDPKKAQAAYSRLSRAVDLRETDDDTAGVVAGVSATVPS